MAPSTSLGHLPDELVLDIIQHLDTARDVSHLARTSTHAHHLVARAGWRTFVRTRFPWFEDGVPWSRAADRLTYLDRCWDRRALRVDLFTAPPLARRKVQSLHFQGVVDAHEDVVVWGAGEDVHVRWAGEGGRCRWRSVLGCRGEYAAGTGDVTAVSIMERRPGDVEVVVGRANGDVQVLGVSDEEAVERSTREPLKLVQEGKSRLGMDRMAVGCVAWRADAAVIVACRGSHVQLHDVSSVWEPRAMSSCDVASPVRDVKFLDRRHLAVALGASSQPIQLATISPTGLVFEAPGRNLHLFSDGDTVPAATTVWSIQPVGTHASLLLGSWQDGTFRLMDLRTPSPHDAVYRDNHQPNNAGGPLLVYGTERFIAGDITDMTLRIFDMRFNKRYFHSAALGCSSSHPQPQAYSPSRVPSSLDIQERGLCDPLTGARCTWHSLSSSPQYRPDATLWFSNRKMERIFSMAKTSDLSDRFYLGLRGGAAEVRLALESDVAEPRVERPSCPDRWRVTPDADVLLGETGVSLCAMSDGGAGADEHMSLPLLFRRDAKHTKDKAAVRSRLDDSITQVLPRRVATVPVRGSVASS